MNTRVNIDDMPPVGALIRAQFAKRPRTFGTWYPVTVEWKGWRTDALVMQKARPKQGPATLYARTLSRLGGVAVIVDNVVNKRNELEAVIAEPFRKATPAEIAQWRDAGFV